MTTDYRKGMRDDLLEMAERAEFDCSDGEKSNKKDLARREHWRECWAFADELAERRTNEQVTD